MKFVIFTALILFVPNLATASLIEDRYSTYHFSCWAIRNASHDEGPEPSFRVSGKIEDVIWRDSETLPRHRKYGYGQATGEIRDSTGTRPLRVSVEFDQVNSAVKLLTVYLNAYRAATPHAPRIIIDYRTSAIWGETYFADAPFAIYQNLSCRLEGIPRI